MSKRLYILNKQKICEEVAEFIINKFNLEPNFDIIELLNKMDIEVIPVKALPADWDYAFNDKDGKMKLFYKEYESKKIDIEYHNRNYRFILATALGDILMFYGLKEENLKKLSYNEKIYYQGNKNTFWRKDFECEHFAACLLMPEYILESRLYDIAKDGKLLYDDLIKIGEDLGVNAQAICQRCKKLSLIYM